MLIWEAMFSAIVDDVVIIKDENGSVYWPEFGLNNIGNISDAAGYQAKLAADQMLEVTGQIDPNMSFNLEEGWVSLVMLSQIPLMLWK